MFSRRSFLEFAKYLSVSSYFAFDAFGKEGHLQSTEGNQFFYQNENGDILLRANQQGNDSEEKAITVLQSGDFCDQFQYLKDDDVIFLSNIYSDFPCYILFLKKINEEYCVEICFYNKEQNKLNYVTRIKNNLLKNFSMENLEYFSFLRNENQKNDLLFCYYDKQENRIRFVSFDSLSQQWITIYETEINFINFSSEEKFIDIKKELFPGEKNIFMKVQPGNGLSFYKFQYNTNNLKSRKLTPRFYTFG